MAYLYRLIISKSGPKENIYTLKTKKDSNMQKKSIDCILFRLYWNYGWLHQISVNWYYHYYLALNNLLQKHRSAYNHTVDIVCKTNKYEDYHHIKGLFSMVDKSLRNWSAFFSSTWLLNSNLLKVIKLPKHLFLVDLESDFC